MVVYGHTTSCGDSHSDNNNDNPSTDGSYGDNNIYGHTTSCGDSQIDNNNDNSFTDGSL